LREKIERFSRGDFEYELPMLYLSEDMLQITVEAGKIYEGSFTISNSAGRSMKGLLYSSHRLLIPERSSFCGSENRIAYRFDATYLKAGDDLQGELTIVSDCGESKLPFHAQIEAPYCITSLGKVRDLFQFANLARMDWTEAKKVFRSEDFIRVILGDDSKYKMIYQHLLKNISTSQALEEFLIAIHKKSKIELSIDKTSLSYQVSDEEFMDKLILTKNHWGYAEIRVSTDAPFIRLEQKFVWADRFIGNTHQVSFVVVPKNMKPGNNFGRIYIKTVYQTITVELSCSYHPRQQEKRRQTLGSRRLPFSLTKNYLELRMDLKNLSQYADAAEESLRDAEAAGSLTAKLMRTHLAIAGGRSKTAGQLLSELKKEEGVLKQSSVLNYCTYLYLEALYCKDEEIIRKATDTIRRYYSSGHSDWRILWLLLYIDRRYEKNKLLKLNDIREQFEAGCRSPILYYEALMIYEEEPYQLRDLNNFELQVMNFGIKNNQLSRETALQFTYLAGRQKNYHPLIFRCLTALYQKYQLTEMLSAICSMLIKGLKKRPEYFEWFRLGVEAQLRITELYEYYVYTADEEMEGPLAEPVLLYFIYNSSLNDRKRAFLYANIIKNKDKIGTFYRSYYKRMEVFALKQLEAHNISPNLAILYREFLEDSTVRPQMEKHLPYVIFTHEIRCKDPNMVSVTVIHRELKEEESTPLNEGRAYIQLYSEERDIFFLDAFGNRYTVSVEYELQPLFPLKEQEYQDLEYLGHPKLLLHLFDRYYHNRTMNEQAINLRRQVLNIQGLREEYRTVCLMDLIDYYYDNYNEELLEHYLYQLKLSYVKEQERVRFMEYLAIRGHFDQVLEALKSYGYEGISVKRLVRLCSFWISHMEPDRTQELLTSLCWYIYSQGKYDEGILNYLIRYYEGPTDQLYHLWKSAEGFELEKSRLEERLLAQILFTEGDMTDSFRIFGSYYRNISNRVLTRAYLTYYGYRYLLHNCKVSEELFSIMRRELNYEENEICLLAWIKYHGGRGKLSQGDKEFAAYHINRLDRKGIRLPFFREYSSLIQLPGRMANKFYIEYKSDPRSQVYLHYRLLKEHSNAAYITERLPNTYLGIHVKEILLFYNEVLEYYITEEADGKVKVSDTCQLRNSREASSEEDSKYNQINLMLLAHELQDEKTVLDMMEHYVKSEFVMEHCFTPII
jgi:hypothetical protein